MTYGSVAYWTLVIERRDGVSVTRHYSWEAATEAYREAVRTNPLSAAVYAGRIKTWHYEANALEGV